ncbi:hypothetical protein QTI33_21580 [Variovorax sp. J22P271]|uniref:hypothetical protein n=1 Tax=Variovorax davisae TaxID=3053515 RepID=UPI002577DE1A|nr:hypothetical protein [Variovorax sp. J22P271]MDM0034740.1 hypothetical protein [Variovorax sp. J22P271]
MPSPSWFATPSWSHSTRSVLRRARPHRPARANTKPTCAAASDASAVRGGDAAVASAPEAFGSLVDLARLQIGTPSAEICDACNTINIGSARHCKCCAHKLPAFYAALEGAQGPQPKALLWKSLGLSQRASAMDFAAFSVVINVLMVITASIPIR